MILAYDNLLKTATLSATSEDANYPLENLYHTWKRKIFKSVTDVLTTTITADFDGDETVDSFFINYHNCTAIEVRLYDVSDTLLDTWTVTNDREHTTVSSVRSVQIELTAPVTIYAGSIFVGSSLQYEKQADQDLPLNSTDVQTFSSDYQVAGREGSVIRSGSITIPMLSATERAELEDAYYECGLVTPFFLDLWESSPTSFDILYGVFTSSLSVTHRYDGDDISFDFTEVN